jgi:hypothetical protein
MQARPDVAAGDFVWIRLVEMNSTVNGSVVGKALPINTKLYMPVLGA